jgi:hypothetical protein
LKRSVQIVQGIKGNPRSTNAIYLQAEKLINRGISCASATSTGNSALIYRAFHPETRRGIETPLQPGKQRNQPKFNLHYSSISGILDKLMK